MTLIALILTSSLFTWTAADTWILCTWTRRLPTDDVHYSFIRSDPRQTPLSLRLYHSSWTAERALRGCAWTDDAAVIQNYLSVCRERAHEFSDHPDERFHVDSVFEEEEEELCVPAASPQQRTARRPVRSAGGSPGSHQGDAERSEVRSLQRVKRGFIVPGTLWCGSGNKAPSYEDLGVFAETDSCCREHDQCKHTILSFHSQFGVFNSNIFTMSHCNCDNKFHSCLMEAKDSISDVVGYTFFNLLKMHCFDFSHRLQCTQRNWFGMCKETQMALYAEVHPPTLYESADVNITANTSTPAEHLDTSTPAEHLDTSTPAEHLDTSTPHIIAAPSTVPTLSTSFSSVTSSSTAPSRDHLEDNLSELDADVTEEQLSCNVYKELDECRIKILPQQRRYGLLNAEDATMYHCNCTSRLFQTLVGQTQLTGVQSVLLGRVSPSCLLLQDCTAGSICAAVLVKAELPQLVQRSSADVEQQRHLQAVNLKVRRPNSSRGKRKLHKLCLRMIRAKVNKRKHRQDKRWRAVRQTELQTDK